MHVVTMLLNAAISCGDGAVNHPAWGQSHSSCSEPLRALPWTANLRLEFWELGPFGEVTVTECLGFAGGVYGKRAGAAG